MIIDSLKNCDRYAALGPEIKEALEYMRRNDITALTDGCHAIRGRDIFMTVGPSSLRSKESAPLEAHDRYIDIQLVLSGEETFGWAERATLRFPRGEGDTEKDILFFDDTPSLYFTLRAGEFAVFFPTDAHAPLIGEGSGRKCIIKVRA